MGKTKKNLSNRSNRVAPGFLLNFDDDDELNGLRPDPIAAIEEQLGYIFLKKNFKCTLILF